MDGNNDVYQFEKKSVVQCGIEPLFLEFRVSIIPLDHQDTRLLPHLLLKGESISSCHFKLRDHIGYQM